MKLNKTIQGVLEVMSTMTIILILTTIDSEWSRIYLFFVLINILVFIASATLLVKFGRWS